MVAKINNASTTWKKVVFIVSSVFFGFAALFLLFEYSEYKANKKAQDKQLLSFDTNDQTFVFYDMYENKINNKINELKG